MNLVDELLKTDAKKAEELKVRTVLSERLAEVLGKNEPVEITIRELPIRRLNDLLAKQFNSKGVYDPALGFDAKAITVGEAVVNPDLKNKDLQQHFNCTNSKQLAAKLFGGEVAGIADAVVELSGIKELKETDDEIKN